ncbi:MAG: glycosyltransferase [Candidatus Omnitrophota bacterium]
MASQIDIIIITYDARDKLERCLRSIVRNTGGLSYRITVVDNGCTDGTSGFLNIYHRKNKYVDIIRSDKNLGFSGGANIALKNTRNELICLMDDDVEVTGGWLRELRREIKARPDAGIVGCKILSGDGRIWSADYRIRLLNSIGIGEIDRGQRDYIKECDALVGPCWLMRRRILDKVGYFDERFFPCQNEDIDYCLRTRLAGYKIVYDGRARIIHHHLFRDGGTAQNHRNRQRFLRKWGKGLLRFPLKDSEPADRHMANGIDHLEMGDFKKALDEFRKMGRRDKRFLEPAYIGTALAGMHEYGKAVEQFKEAIYSNPSNMGAHHRLALIYKKMGLVKKARDAAARTFDFVTSRSA